MKAIEFFSGIGGIHCALQKLDEPIEVVASFDINDNANRVYRHNFNNPCYNKIIESLTAEDLTRLGTDLWLMSPPCQPYTRNGNQLDLADNRTSPMKHMIKLIADVRPKMIFFENVKGFDVSDGRDLLIDTLHLSGYTIREYLLTPLQFGVPNSRLRYYLTARLSDGNDCKSPILLKPRFDCPISNCRCPVCLKLTIDIGCDHLVHYVDSVRFCEGIRNFLVKDNGHSEDDPEEAFTFVDDKQLQKGFSKFDIVTESSGKTSCFIKCYTKKLEGSGSYLQTITSNEASELKQLLEYGQISIDDYSKRLRIRYFTPREVANFMCFPKEFTFPRTVSRNQRYRMLGNSVNVLVVAHVIHWLLCDAE